MLRYLTGGESHGSCLTAILEGMPAGVILKEEEINYELSRRQVGYGRGGRMEIERDRIEITSGVRFGKTLGSPITLVIKNLDFENWRKEMSIYPQEEKESKKVTQPRPGHADLAGILKYGEEDIRNILERSSARETAARVAIGAVAKQLLREFQIKVLSYVTEIGGIKADLTQLSLKDIEAKAEASSLRCPDEKAEKEMKTKIDQAKARGDSLGGIFEVVVRGVPVGLGSHVHWDRKLDGRLAQALMSIQAIKGVEIGLGFEAARRFGSEVHDEIFYYPFSQRQEKEIDQKALDFRKASGFYRKSNHAGGIEGGISNGEDILLRAAMKPISTLYTPLRSVDIRTKKEVLATVERADICRVPSAGVIGEAVVALEIARSFLGKFGGDSLPEIKRNYQGYLEYLRNF